MFNPDSNKPSANGKRRQARKRLIYYFDVIDAATQNTVGKVVDITTDGMRLVCSSIDDFRKGERFALEIETYGDDGSRHRIPVTAERRWVKKSDNTKYFESGFRFVFINDTARQDIARLIDTSTFEAFHVVDEDF